MANQAVQHYETRAGQHWRWQHAAREFMSAANRLADLYELCGERSYVPYSPMMVLYAIAVENLLKAIRVAQGVEVTSNGELSRYFSKHDMIGFAQDAGLTLTMPDSDFLQKLRDLIESGKYPIAKSPSSNKGAWVFSYPADLEHVRAILEQFEEALRSTGKPCLVKVDLSQI